MHKRMFPAYTTAQLEKVVADFDAGKPLFSSVETVEAIKVEIAARKAGVSQVSVTPHYDGPMVIGTI